MAKPTGLSGLFSGQLDFIMNKKDVDLNIQLYELTLGGEYVQLSFHKTRASYVRDRSHRQTFRAGMPQKLQFTNRRLTSRMFESGSRLVVVLSILKHLDAEINYGTGKDVSDEDIKGGAIPLQIKWQNDRFVKIPIWK